MTVTQRLVLRFNAFTGQLEDGYWLSRVAGVARMVGDPMRPAAVYAYLASHPETRCDALKV